MALELQHQQEVAARIREKRGKVPQPEIAGRVGVTLRAYQEWEAGGGIKWSNYSKLASALGTTVDYLMNGNEEAAQAVEDASRSDQLDRIERMLEMLLDHFELDKDAVTRFLASAERAALPPGEHDSSQSEAQDDEDATDVDR